MPKFLIETTTQVRRVYEIEAPTINDAEDAFENTDGRPSIIMEEDISEDVDNIRPAEAGSSAGGRNADAR